MTTSTPPTSSSGPEWDLGEWPNMLSFRTYSGKSVFFLVGRSGLLIALSVYAGLFGSTTLLALALAALVVDLAHTVPAGHDPGAGNVPPGVGEAAGRRRSRIPRRHAGQRRDFMYARVLEALRQALIRSRQLDAATEELSEELRKNNETLTARSTSSGRPRTRLSASRSWRSWERCPPALPTRSGTRCSSSRISRNPQALWPGSWRMPSLTRRNWPARRRRTRSPS